MSPAEQRRLAAIALELAAVAPLRRGQNVYAAQIPWSLIERARDELDGAGFDWRAFRREHYADR